MKDFFKEKPLLSQKPVVLLAPLDWGLGHATRCIPIIKLMLQLDFEVFIAGEGKQKAILQTEFPQLKWVDLAGYRLKYGTSAKKTAWKIFLQIPKILTSINREHRWLNRFLAENKVDLVISDNRYGFYHPAVTSIFITHQLTIKTPWGGLSERFLRQLNYYLINRFSRCWVPDFRDDKTLAGELSHPPQLPAIPVDYIGCLTRLYKTETSLHYELCIILSGPEPQRSLLESLLLKELQHFHQPVLLVRGLPGSTTSLPSFNQVTIVDHMPSEVLNKAVNASKLVISRSGYSTVMDMMHLGKTCIFIPTPGQTEQEYLAAYLSGKNYCLSFSQQAFSLKEALLKLEEAALVPFEVPAHHPSELMKLIREAVFLTFSFLSIL